MATSEKNPNVEIPEGKETTEQLVAIGWSLVREDKKTAIMRRDGVTIKRSQMGYWDEVL